MPLYEYECAKCKKRFEKIESVSSPAVKKCPECGGRAERLVSRSAIQFKGSGWYVTDYAKKSSASSGSAGGSAESGETKPPAKTEGKSDGGSETKAPATAPATKESAAPKKGRSEKS